MRTRPARILPHSHTGMFGQIIDALALLEAEQHSEGWGLATRNGVFCRLALSSQPELSLFDEFRIQLGEVSYPSVEMQLLKALGATAIPLLEKDFRAPPVAHLLCMRAWMYQDRVVPHADWSVADRPGAAESLWAFAVTRDRLAIVTRIRGQDPTLYATRQLDQLTGTAADLRDIHHNTLSYWMKRGRRNR